MTLYPKRLIEVDLPIKKISAHARREKSIRHGHISTLHIWWARRPLAACRAVICAALWPDPADELCPQPFREAAAKTLAEFAEQARTDLKVASLIKDHWSRWHRTNETSLRADDPACWPDMRYALLDFIADFANWDASTVPAFLKAARALTQAAHESLGGIPGTRPLVVDPFAGGGAIPLESLRVGADAYASDLNPVAVLLNKVILEYIPKYGNAEFRMINDEGKEIVLHGLGEAVRYWGNWIKRKAEQELAEFYPKDFDGATPIAYLWARTIISEAPDDGTGIPVEVPLIRSLWLAKKKGHSKALRWQRDEQGKIQTETVEITYANGIACTVRRPLLEIFEPKSAKEVENGTVTRGAATCPITGYTTPVGSVRRQLKKRRGGTTDARLFAIVTTRSNQPGRFYRLPTRYDLEAVQEAVLGLEQRKQIHSGSLSLVPNEPTPQGGGSGAGRAFSQRNYGMSHFEDLFTSRQALALITLTRLVQEVGHKLAMESERELAVAVQTCLGLILDRQADALSSLVRWRYTVEAHAGTFGRQALPMMWDFVEIFPFSGSTGDWSGAIEWVAEVCEFNKLGRFEPGHIERDSAITHPFPMDFAQVFATDPPYYDAVPYADLSDFFYVWLKRTVGKLHSDILDETLSPKADECIVDEIKGKDKTYFETAMRQAMAEGQRILAPDGIGVVVFAHKSTTGWEAQIQAMIDARWTITGSWPIDTERPGRLRSQDSAALASSIHLVCRPRKNLDGSPHTDVIGDWRDVLQELPQRIHTWLPRLTQEGIIGADAIFACLGPALEIFSRYSQVEKASGEPVKLRDYLGQVWAAVAREALNTIFEGADTSGFEEDARLTAIWFWTLKAAANGNGNDTALETETEEDVEESEGDKPSTDKKKKISGYVMEYDAARKLAQGLGADLAKLSRPGGIITIKGNIAALNGIAHRENHLIGRQLSLFVNEAPLPKARGRGKPQTAQAAMEFVSNRGPSLSQEPTPIQVNNNQPLLPLFQSSEYLPPLLDRLLDGGVTVLDRLHQAMLLFGRSQTALLGPFLQATHMGSDLRFWRLANALSALYPPQSEEKRWVDGVLGRKKALRF